MLVIVRGGVIWASAVLTSYYASNPSKFNATNNIWYRADLDFTKMSEFFYKQSTTNPYSVNVDRSNKFINPGFTNPATLDFSIAAGSNICGRGSVSGLPAGGDITGSAWAGNDIGAHKCSSATTPAITLQDTVAFAGDSIMKANGVSPSAYSYFNTQTGISYADMASAATPGFKIGHTFGQIDYLMITQRPKTVFLAVGINDFTPTGFYPTDATATQQYADKVIEAMKKIQDYGATPIWLGIGSLNNYGGLSDTKIIDFNTDVRAGCVTNGWSCGDYFTQMKLNASWQSNAAGGGYYNTNGDVHPNSAGQTIIGMTAEYLYYTKYTLGTDKVDPTGSFRIYKDGKYRYSTATSGSATADFSVAPVAGYDAFNYAPYIDATLNTWQTTGQKNKQWTASSTVATNTIYTIGDLVPNGYYNFSLDASLSAGTISGASCSGYTCRADTDGKLSFTYSGGYSSHTFALTYVNNSPTDISLSSNTIAENSISNTTIGSLTTTDFDNNQGDTHTYSFTCATPGADDSRFNISGSSLRNNVVFDYESPVDANGDNNYQICIRTTDSGSLYYDKNFTISVTDVASDNLKSITAFSITNQETSSINETNQTISVTMPYGTSLTSLTPTITFNGASVSPNSGVSQDFTNSVTYTVTALDSTTQAYVVTVSVGADPNIALLSADKTALTDSVIKGTNADLSHITTSLTNPLLATGSVNGSTITWASSNTAVVSNDGQTINRPSYGSGNATVTLTATLTKGAVIDTKAFVLTVLEKEQTHHSSGGGYLPGYGPNAVKPAVTPSNITQNISQITKTLKQGLKKNEQVKILQTYLNTVLKLNLTVDGNFGLKTKLAVISLQKAHGLKADGVVGKNTLKVMGE